MILAAGRMIEKRNKENKNKVYLAEFLFATQTFNGGYFSFITLLEGNLCCKPISNKYNPPLFVCFFVCFLSLFFSITFHVGLGNYCVLVAGKLVTWSENWTLHESLETVQSFGVVELIVCRWRVDHRNFYANWCRWIVQQSTEF